MVHPWFQQLLLVLGGSTIFDGDNTVSVQVVYVDDQQILSQLNAFTRFNCFNSTKMMFATPYFKYFYLGVVYSAIRQNCLPISILYRCKTQSFEPNSLNLYVSLSVVFETPMSLPCIILYMKFMIFCITERVWMFWNCDRRLCAFRLIYSLRG